MNKRTLQALNRIAHKTNCPYKVTDSNAEEFIKTVAKNHGSDVLVNELEKITLKAIHAWESYVGSKGNIQDISDSYYDIVDAIIKPLGMTTDRGVGLYPTYEIEINGRKYTEYTPLNAIRRYNNFWNNND